MAERNNPSSPAKGSERGNIGSETGRGATTATARGNTPGESREESGTAGIADRVKERASAQLNTQKDRATEGLGTMAQAIRQPAQQLRDQHHETVAGYVEQAADQIDKLSRGLKNKDVGELVNDAQRLARRRPALFVGSAFAVGLVGARFLKSSPPDDESGYGRGDYRRGGYGESGSGSWRQGSEGYGRDPGHALPSAAPGTTAGSAGVAGAPGASGTPGAGGTPGTTGTGGSRSRTGSSASTPSSSPSRDYPGTERS